MGGGYWKRSDFVHYSGTFGRIVKESGFIDTSGIGGARDMYKARKLCAELNPYKVVRECCDSEEHPETVPVILALDVTGSMGGALVKTASSLSVIMESILDQYRDVEFMIMGIGDLSYDQAPIQISQFESDIRIAEHLDRVWFERGGGGNAFESYTAAWYMGLRHTSLDCWKRGKKGIIITLGDEPMNPYLPADQLAKATGDRLQGDVETTALYRETLEKFEIFHIAIDDEDDCYCHYREKIKKSFGALLKKRFRVSTLNSLPAAIIQCLEESGVCSAKSMAAEDTIGRVGWSTEPAESGVCSAKTAAAEDTIGRVSRSTEPAENSESSIVINKKEDTGPAAKAVTGKKGTGIFAKLSTIHW